MRVVIEIKRDGNANVVLNQLLKHTQMETTFGVILLSLVDGRPRVLDALLQAPPRLDPIADLGEGGLWKPGSEPSHQPLERCAPRPFDLIRLAAVDADNRPRATAGQPHLGARRELDDLHRPTVSSGRHPLAV